MAEHDRPASGGRTGPEAGAEDHVVVAPERYEFTEPPRYRFELSRRRFLESVGAGVAVLVAVRNGRALMHDERHTASSQTESISAWLHVGEDGTVTVFTGKVEVGQDIRTSLTQTVADELHIATSSVRMVMGDTDLTPYDAGTFGSRSTPQMGTQLRKAAAAARDTLVDMAAQRWDVPADRLVLREGRVLDEQGGRALGIGELTAGERMVRTIDGDAESAPANRWTVAGTALPKVSGRDIVTGRHRYASDLRPDDLRTGKVLRPPASGARLVSVDVAAAEAMPGVVVVRDGDFVGVAAADELTATRALAAIRADWTDAAPQPSHATVFEHLKRTARDGRVSERGSVEAGLAEAAVRHDAVYTTAYIAHVPLEPRAAVAEWTDGKLTVSTGTQRPFAVRAELARALRIPEERVRVLVPDTGSGYGGKHTGEVAVEAARLARAAERPVRLVWTREEEFEWAYFRPAAHIEVRSGARRDGTLTAWEFHDYNAGASGIATPYDAANVRTVFHAADSPLRQGSYRALAATANTFARETHMDELAERLSLDPLAFRLRNLAPGRLRDVLERAAQGFEWNAWQATPGRGIGIACGTEKGGYVATCAEVAVDRGSGAIRIVRIVEAFECGAIVNPDGLRNQVEGAVVMGLGGALWEAMEFEDGRILNPRLSQYRVPRFSDVPPIETLLIDRKDLPSAGAGETPIITLAPALGSAIQRASGLRLRSLPLAPHGLSARERG